MEHTTSYILARLSLLCLHTGTAGAFCTLMYLASMYTQLTFWLPNIQAQLMYIQYIQSILPTLVTIKNWSVIFSAAAYAFISLSNEGWFGLVSFVTVVAALVPVLQKIFRVLGPLRERNRRFRRAPDAVWSTRAARHACSIQTRRTASLSRVHAASLLS